MARQARNENEDPNRILTQRRSIKRGPASRNYKGRGARYTTSTPLIRRQDEPTHGLQRWLQQETVLSDQPPECQKGRVPPGPGPQPAQEPASINYWRSRIPFAPSREDSLWAVFQSLLDAAFRLIIHLQEDNLFLRLCKVGILQGPSHDLWREVPQRVTQDRELSSQA